MMATLRPSATISKRAGCAYLNSILPGRWTVSWPSERLPPGPTWTKSAVITRAASSQALARDTASSADRLATGPLFGGLRLGGVSRLLKLERRVLGEGARAKPGGENERQPKGPFRHDFMSFRPAPASAESGLLRHGRLSHVGERAAFGRKIMRFVWRQGRRMGGGLPRARTS